MTANGEAHVSMSMAAALKAERALELASRVIAVEILLACQAIDLLAPLATSAALAAVHAYVRTRVPMLVRDRPPSPDIEWIAKVVAEGWGERACAGEVKKEFFRYYLTTRAYVSRLLPFGAADLRAVARVRSATPP